MKKRTILSVALISITVFAGFSVIAKTVNYKTVKDRLLGKRCDAGLEHIRIPQENGYFEDACVRISRNSNPPVLVNFHQWSGDYTEANAEIVDFVGRNDINLIIPNLNGPNNHPDACGSADVISDMNSAIDFMVQRSGGGEKTRVAVLGISGGGFAALHHLYRGRRTADYYSIWVPMTDLAKWHRQSANRGLKYASDIEKCTGLVPNELTVRSPITYARQKALSNTRILLGAGVHDGHGEYSVPISHSLDLYDVWASSMGGAAIHPETRSQLLTMDFDAKSGDNLEKIILHEKAGNAELVIFDGGHEMLGSFAIAELEKALKLP